MSTTHSSRATTAKKAPQLALRLGTLPVDAASWRDGSRIAYLGRELIVRLGTHHGVAELDGEDLHLPLPPEANARQIQDSAEAWLRQQCVENVEQIVALMCDRQLVPIKQVQRQETTSDKMFARLTCTAPLRVETRCPIRVQLSFAARSPWLAVEGEDTLRCYWRLIELAPAVIEQHAKKALIQLTDTRDSNTTADMFGALPA